MKEYILTIPKRIWFTVVIASISPIIAIDAIWTRKSALIKHDRWSIW